MPQITVRPYEDKDREAFFHVRAMTFNDGRPIPAEDQVFKTTNGYVAEVDGKIAGVFSILEDFTCTRGGATLKDAAVAGVAVLPEYRVTGVGREMMTWALRHFREQGIPMASLYAFRESYYRKFGYEVCGSRIKISVPTSIFPKVKPILPVRRLDPSDISQLKPCYQAFSVLRSGMNLRTDKHWSRVIGKDTAIYVAGEEPYCFAYLLVDHKWQFWESQAASEFAWASRAGYDSILSVLGGVGINKSTIEWYEPNPSPFLSYYMDHGVQANVERLVMYRVTDVPACIRALKTTETGSFSVFVKDELIPENEGPWHVAFSPAGVEVTKTDIADFDLTINEFVQVFLGQPSLQDIGTNGFAKARPGALDGANAAKRLFTPMTVYCTDFF